MNKKLRIGVIFGGRSGEHEISLRSAESVINSLDREKYEIIPIGITQEGKWLMATDPKVISPKEIISIGGVDLGMLGTPTDMPIVCVTANSISTKIDKLDVLFPVLHGTYGEDGTIQGLFEMANIPYVGCGVAASAVGMDKVLMKNLFREAGLPIVKFIWFLRSNWETKPENIRDSILNKFEFPIFVKPANLGSSVGISKVTNQEALDSAINKAARYDRKIIIEQGIDAREIEVSILGNDEPIVSVPGEIIPGADFYDYKDKYKYNNFQLNIPAEIPVSVASDIQQIAIQAFKSIDGSGLARIDFFIERNSGNVLLNEINTMPGFTSISMYPKLWEVSGISYDSLLDKLIQLAIDRHKEKSRSITHFEDSE